MTASSPKAMLLTTIHGEYFEVPLTKNNLIQMTYKSACLTSHLVNILFTPITTCDCQHWTEGLDFVMGRSYCKDLQVIRVKTINAYPQMGFLNYPPNAQGTSCKRSHEDWKVCGREQKAIVELSSRHGLAVGFLDFQQLWLQAQDLHKIRPVNKRGRALPSLQIDMRLMGTFSSVG